MVSLTYAEVQELVDGVRRGFAEVEFLNRFLDAFIFDVRTRAASPVDVFLSILQGQEGVCCPDVNLQAILCGTQLRQTLNTEWSRQMRQNRLSGHIIASFTALCVEAYLQNGAYFSKGINNNDLTRHADGSRWEIKGLRARRPLFTINQSHVGVDDTTFLVYCGRAENNELYGVYYFCGRDECFTSAAHGRNMRRLLPNYEERLVRLYPVDSIIP